MGSFLKRLTALFYPNRCYICDAVLPYPETVCDKCREKPIHYRTITGATCDVCGLKLQNCICRPGRLYDKAVFPLFFEDEVRRSLHRLKFRGRLDKVKPFAAAMAEALNDRGAAGETDVLTFIPMSRKKERRRGYNQAQLLCEALGELLEIPVVPLLCKYQDVATQHDIKKYLLRSGNALGTYEPIREALSEIEGKRILLVDDILTTGSTLNEAAKTLLIFGADTVNVTAAAAVRKKNRPKKGGRIERQ